MSRFPLAQICFRRLGVLPASGFVTEGGRSIVSVTNSVHRNQTDKAGLVNRVTRRGLKSHQRLDSYFREPNTYTKQDLNLARKRIEMDGKREKRRHLPASFCIQNVLEVSKNQGEVGALYKVFNKSNQKVKTQMIRGLMPEMPGLCKHEYARYFIVFCIENATQVDGTKNIQNLESELFHSLIASQAIELSMDKYGLFCVKACLKKPEQRQRIIDQLLRPTGLNKKYIESYKQKNGDPSPSAIVLAGNTYGSHTIDAIFKYGEAADIAHLHRHALEHAVELSLSKFGCFFIKNAIKKGTQEQRLAIFNQLCCPTGANEEFIRSLDRSQDLLTILSGDKYGTHVVQALFDHWCVEIWDGIHKFMVSRFLHLSRDVHGSYILQKYLESTTSLRVADIINTVFLSRAGGSSSDVQEDEADIFVEMGRCMYGRHVLEQLISFSQGNDREKLEQEILVRQKKLCSSVDGKRFFSRVLKQKTTAIVL